MKLDQLLRREPAAAGVRADGAVPGLVVGGLPTVSLLPAELRSASQERTVKRVLGAAVLTAVLLAAAGTGIASAVAAGSADRLDRAQAASRVLTSQVARFQDVQSLQRSIALGTAAVSVGGSTEIDWRTQIARITADMPADYSILTITTDSATPIAAYPQGTTPIELPRAATVQLTVAGSSIQHLPGWLWKLRSIPAYADAETTVSNDPVRGYSVQLVVHLTKEALMAQPAQGAAQ